MRSFIKTCSGLFVILGMLAVGGSVLAGVVTLSSGFGGGLLMALAGIACGASVTLVGGGTYLLASLDERVERLLVGKQPETRRSVIQPPPSGLPEPDVFATVEPRL